MKVKYYRVTKTVSDKYYLEIYLQGNGFWPFRKEAVAITGPYICRADAEEVMRKDIAKRIPDQIVSADYYNPIGGSYP